jgi:hypothetical protein
VLTAWSCAVPLEETETTSESLLGMNDALGTRENMAHVGFADGNCSGTLITRTMVLTAAHCLKGKPPTFQIRTNLALGSTAQESRTASLANCFVHPSAYDPGFDTCAEIAAQPPSLPVVDKRFDLALLQIDTPFTAAVPRSIGVPRHCGTVDTVVRGYAGGTRNVGRFRWQHTAASTLQSWVPIPSTATFAINPGDSGSGIVESDRPNAPVIAVISGDSMTASPHLWRSENQAFLWSVLGVDAMGTPICSGGTTPCILRGNTTPERDVDRDGLPDIRDRCPNRPFSTDCTTTHGGLTNQHCDADEDFVGDGCDSFPGVCNHDDDDRDTIPDANDACPDDRRIGAFGSSGGMPVAPPGTTDTDLDAVPDSCDLCPLTPNAQGIPQGDRRIDMMSDSDSDGVPAACDNCGTEPNPSQENCNFDAEKALALINFPLSMPGIGDACDTFQCGETLLAERTVSTTTAMDEIRVDTLRVPVPPISGYRAWTGTRFCRCTAADFDDPTEREQCATEQFDGTGKCSYATVFPYDFGPSEDPTWRLTTVNWVPRFLPPDDTRLAAPRTEAFSYYLPPDSAFVVDRRGHWATATDISRWTSTFGGMISWGPGSPLRGIMWTHTPGDTSAFSETTRRRTSHYWSGPVGAPRTIRAPWPCLEFIGAFGMRPDRCPDCAAAFPSWLGAPVSGPCDVGSHAPSGPPYVQFADNYVDLAEIFTSPPTWLTNPQDPEWAVSRWVAAPDASAPGASALRYARLNRNTGVVLRTLNESAGGLVTGCASTCTNQGTLPSVSAGYFATASAKHQSVWVLAANGALSRYSTASSQWESVPLLLPLGTIEALAYEPRWEELLLLDRFTDAAGTRVRLFRVPLHGGSAQLWAQWSRQASTTDFALASDGRGIVYLTASTTSAYCVLAFDSRTPAGDVAPTAWRARQGSGRIQTEWVSADRRGFSAPILLNGATTLAGFDDDDFVPLTPQILAQCL